MERLEGPGGSVELERRPPAGHRPLRAWDAADEYLLHVLAEEDVVSETGRVLVVNDAFGALSVALTCGLLPPGGTERSSPPLPPQLLTDSHTSVLATRENLARNDAAVAPGQLVVHAGPEALRSGRGTDIELVLLKVPKSLALLEDQVRRIAAAVPVGTPLLAAAMTRHLPRAAIDVLDRILGPVRVGPARKKARVVRGAVAAVGDPGPWDWPREYAGPGGEVVVDLPGVHAAGRLDPGTAHLLANLDDLTTSTPDGAPGTVVDLGCGDGIVGLAVARAHPGCELVMVDDSPLAVASAELTLRRNLGDLSRMRFVVADVFEDQPGGCVVVPGSVDAVLANPPFHMDRAMGDQIAWRMFSEAHRVLRSGGELRVVGNRHLGYHAKLSRLFGSSEVLGADPRFVVCRAFRR